MHNKIAELRTRAGMTQKQLANKLGVSQQAVYYYEQGDRDIKASLLVSMAKALGCTISDLLDVDLPNEGANEYRLTTEEASLIRMFRSTDRRGRDTIIAVAESQERPKGTQGAKAVSA